MIQYNNTNEFNSIQTGQTVFVSGLPGRSFKMVNNKYGWIKNIFVAPDKNRIKYTAEVFVPKDNESYFVDFDYIYRIGKHMNRADISSIVWEENPFNHYIMKKDIVEAIPMQDDNGQLLAVCTDSKQRKHVFLYSGIN